MKIGPEVLIYFLVIVFGIYVMVEMIGVQDSAQIATAFQENMIDKIENSNFNPTVIDECLRTAEDNGYTVEIQDRSQIVDSEVKHCYMLKLKYNVKINLLNINQEKYIINYAR